MWTLASHTWLRRGNAVDDLISAIETLRARVSHDAPRLYLNDAEYAYFKAHEWIDFGIGSERPRRVFTNAQCYEDTGIHAHIEIMMVKPIPLFSDDLRKHYV